MMRPNEVREALGKIVRDEWMRWAKEQPNPKPSWLVPWDGLSEPDKEVDRRIGERLFYTAVTSLTLGKDLHKCTDKDVQSVVAAHFQAFERVASEIIAGSRSGE